MEFNIARLVLCQARGWLDDLELRLHESQNTNVRRHSKRSCALAVMLLELTTLYSLVRLLYIPLQPPVLNQIEKK